MMIVIKDICRAEPMRQTSQTDVASTMPASDETHKILPIFLVVLIDVLGLMIILPLLPFYSEQFGATPFVVGMLISSYALCQLVSAPLLGRWSDHMGRKPLLIVSQVGTCLGFLLLALANSLPLIFLSRIIDGLTAGNISLAQAYISDVTRPEKRRPHLARSPWPSGSVSSWARASRPFFNSSAPRRRSSPRPSFLSVASSAPPRCSRAAK
jgi:MFS family permease